MATAMQPADYLDADQIIFKTTWGSRLYGVDTPQSDIDRRGVFLERPSCLLGLEQRMHHFPKTNQRPSEMDDVCFSVHKWILMACENHPVALEMLFADREYWTCVHPSWIDLYHIRIDFLSQRVRTIYGGIITERMKNLDRQYKWTRQGPDAHEQKSYDQWIAKMGARMERIRSFGYDTKDAAHVVRQLIQGVQLLRSPLAYNPRLQHKDAQDVRSVLRGDVDYTLFRLYVDAELQHLQTCPSELPREPRTDRVNNWMMETYRKWLC